jgi:hypothetical protein
VKANSFEAIGLLGLMLTAFAACAYLPFFAKKPPPPKVVVTPTPTPSPVPTPIPTETPEPTKHRRRKRPTPTPGSTPVSSSTPAVSASPVAGTGTLITTGEPGQAHGEIERTIDQIQGRLATISRSRLNAEDAADYDRIKDFIADARTALKEQDDLRARSLAEKATRLLSQLAGRVPSP